MSLGRFDGVVVLKGHFAKAPDLRSTIMQGHVDLQHLTIKDRPPDPGKVNEEGPKVAKDKEAILRRLKELAEGSRHHEAALNFFALERRAKRWHQLSKAASALEWVYDALSQYGQSIGRPILGLVVTLAVFAALYAFASDTGQPHGLLAANAALASVTNTLPFVPAALDIRREVFDDLFIRDVPEIVQAVRLLNGLLGFVFLFLIGLGLRNRFRL